MTRRDPSTLVNVVVAVSKKVKPFHRFCDNLEKIGLDGMRIIFVFHENDVDEVRPSTFSAVCLSLSAIGMSIQKLFPLSKKCFRSL